MTELAILFGVLGERCSPRSSGCPLLGACLFLLANPLIVGIARGELGTVLRPNEVLLLFILVALGLRVLLLALCGRYRPPPFDGMDVALLGLVATGSALPVLLQEVRNLPPSLDDTLYAVVLVKYYGAVPDVPRRGR